MANSELFLATKLNALHSALANNYLLKHGNIFMKPEIPIADFPYAFFPSELGYHGNGGIPGCDVPLDFAIKHEKPPTPPASTSPVSPKTPTSNDEKNPGESSATWILGKQKLSWDDSTVASYNPETKMFKCVVCNAVGFLSRIAEHYLGTHTSAKVFQCLHCPYSSTWSRCVRMHMAKHHGVPNAPPSLWKGQPLLEEIFQLLTNLKTTVDSQGRDRADPEVPEKKFVCPKCPYTTDRRDLYLRHENIHKEDKPYHCYICFKLFNRADHVKKHFLRIHRGHPYDISLVRRRPPRSQSYASKNLNNNNNNNIASKTDAPTIINPDEAKRIASMDTVLKDSNGTINGFQKAKGFECPFCPWEGIDAWCLRRHMNTHNNFGCPICDFNTSKAERLFTHVYKFHRMLVCTKCNFNTDQAQLFESHIKECCVEMVQGPPSLNKLPNQDDSAIDSDAGSPGYRNLIRDTIRENKALEINAGRLCAGNSINANSTKPYPNESVDFKGSISITHLPKNVSPCLPMHSYRSIGNTACFPGMKRDEQTSVILPKTELKAELASPVLSSSDSGLADISNDISDLDLACFECGCEFADESSLATHSELYHRMRDSVSSPKPCHKKMKFSCALCDFTSNEQTTILDHMRFHTGDILVCRAESTCAFTTIFDSVLREHVQAEHTDGNPRCPHCGMPCKCRTTFIRHYRSCHHSTSCYRCRELKHHLQKSESSTVVQPYLRHNPYSKANRRLNEKAQKDIGQVPLSVEKHSSDDCQNGRRSRKQSTPKKVVHPVTKARKSHRRRKKRSALVLAKRRMTSHRTGTDKLLKSFRKRYRNFWMKNLADQGDCEWCRKCNMALRHEYQAVIHRRHDF